MTQPRRILPGQFYMVTRRTSQRMFLLRPDEEVKEAFEYCLGEAAERHEIQVIAWVAMSNHYHAIVYDPRAKLPAFTEHFHKMLAKCLNVYLGRSENFWSSEETCVTRLVSLEDVFDKVVYVLANPASAHLVDNVADWPGSSSWDRMNKTTGTTRPRFYFRENGVMPPAGTLSAVVPPGLEGETATQWINRVKKMVGLRQDELRQERRSKGTKVVGKKNVLETKVSGRPSTKKPKSKLRPALACKDPERMKKERAALRGFRTAYRRCLDELRAETKLRFGRTRSTKILESDISAKIEFPAGTYRMRIFFSIACERFRAAA